MEALALQPAPPPRTGRCQGKRPLLALLLHLAASLSTHTSRLTGPFYLLTPVSARGRYTGYVRGLGETFAQTPVYAQLTAARPAPPHFLHTRGAGAPVPTPARDPCNYPERSKPGAPQPTLWPSLQQHGAPSMVRASGAGRCMVLGDVVASLQHLACPVAHGPADLGNSWLDKAQRQA